MPNRARSPSSAVRFIPSRSVSIPADGSSCALGQRDGVQTAYGVLGRDVRRRRPSRTGESPTEATRSSTMPSGSRRVSTSSSSRVCGASTSMPRAGEPLVPPAEGGLRHAERGRRGHPRALPALRHARPREEGQQAGRAALLVAVVQVVGVRGVEVDRLLDQPQPQRAGVEVDVRLRVGGDRGDVMEPVRADGRHGPSVSASGTARRPRAATPTPRFCVSRPFVPH